MNAEPSTQPRLTHTPWGAPETQRELAPGIVSVTTASHGGLWLSPERQQIIDQLFPRFRSFAGGAWYEEDEDWAVPALVFNSEAGMYDTEAEKQRAAYHAIEVATAADRREMKSNRAGRGWDQVVEWLYGSQEGHLLRSRAALFEFTIRDKWRVGGSMTATPGKYPLHSQVVFLHRNGERKQVVMLFPEQDFYSDDELAELEIKPTGPLGAAPAHAK